MTFDYSNAVATATRLISAYGRSMVLRSTTETGDPWAPVQSNVNTDIIGVSVEFRRSEIDGDVIRTDDKRILINSSVTPTLQDRIIDDSVDYSIVNIREVKPGGSTIFYDLQVRV